MKIIRARIHLEASAKGEKPRSIGRGGDYACPVYFPDVPALSEHAWDCRLLLGATGMTLHAGQSADDIPVAFLSPDEVLPAITVGTRFILWEMGAIGEGEVSVVPDLP